VPGNPLEHPENNDLLGGIPLRRYHQALKLLNAIESPSKLIALWALGMAPYSFKVSNHKRKLNVLADALSRMLKEEVHGAEFEEDEWIKQKLLAIDRDLETWPAGHLGIRKTKHRIMASYYWQGMYTDTYDAAKLANFTRLHNNRLRPAKPSV